MSAIPKQSQAAAAQELWRVAEDGDVDELLRLLPGVVDVNVSNKYGMTALMRAAYHGHERVVRALLDRGADPNITRNDKFTALALAAFFGHTETVRILIEHGARTEVVTRCGTSARMWATARTFDEAARCLKKPSRAVPALAAVTAPPAPVIPPSAPVREVVAPILAPPVVKTLSDPPEIWDLVHEMPRTFDPRSAFVSRIMSMKRSFALGVLTGLLVIVGCGVGTLVLRNSQARNLPPEFPSNQNAIANTSVSVPSAVQTPEAAATVPEPAVNESTAEATVNNHLVGARKFAPVRQIRMRPVTDENVVVQNEQSTEAPVVATPKLEAPKPSEPPKSKPANGLSPQLIAPSKSAPPPKTKVIQWP
jgi:hypothetical protein